MLSQSTAESREVALRSAQEKRTQSKGEQEQDDDGEEKSKEEEEGK